MKTKEELNAIKEEFEALNQKLHKLTEEELAQVSGGNEGYQEEETDLSNVVIENNDYIPHTSRCF